MDKQLKILILEDIAEESNLIERAIRKEKIDFKAVRVDNREQFISNLEEFRPDIVLSDHALPQFNSIEALKLCRKENDRIPFILVTGTVSEEFAVTCLKQGADDYILKSNLSRLSAAIKNAIAHREIERQKYLAEKEITHQNERLLVTNAALTKTNDEFDHLVYNVSNNLRGPISSILGLINLGKMEDPGCKHPGTPYFDMIAGGITRIERTINDIIHFSRNARISQSLRDVSISKLFLENFENLRKLFPLLVIDLDMNISHDIIITDPERLDIIFNNLLYNSMKFHDPLKERKIIQLTTKKENDFITLMINDNGIGISRDALPFIFNMFYRGTEKSDGAGLGLYVVKEAVEKLGGRITAHSEENEGTTMTIQLPNNENR